MSEGVWDEAPLGDCMEAIIDYRGKSPKKTKCGVPLVTARVIKNGRILPAGEFVAETDYDAWMRRGLPEAGDVVVTTEAPLGEVAQIRDPRVALAQRVILLRPKADLLSKQFLALLLQGPVMQHRLAARATGTTVLGIRQSELRKVLLPLPPTDWQQAVVRVLSALDDKIDLNGEMNRTLEAMAQAIFRSWFVDFDPVVAKSEGREPFGMDAATAALFPDRFVESELGPIPEGWEVTTFGTVARLRRQVVDPANLDPELPYVGLEHIPRQHVVLTDWGSASDVSSAKTAFRQRDILFGKLRPYFHKVVEAPMGGVCSTDILVICPNESTDHGLVLALASSAEFVAHADSGSSGTRMPRARWEHMQRFAVAWPPFALRERFTSLLAPMMDLANGNTRESQTLASLRDLLLPKLLSGEIRVPEAEEIVEGVA
jgi:type I restriction enzyme S subunit